MHGSLEVENQDEEEDVVHVKKVVNQGNHEEEIKEKAEKEGNRVENLEEGDVVKFLDDFRIDTSLLFSPFLKSISIFLER